MAWPKGKPSWNKGLTRKTDSRVEKYAKSLTGKKFTLKHRKRLSQILSDGRLCGEKNPNWKGGLITITCPICHAKKQKKKKDVIKNELHYCSVECKNAGNGPQIKKYYEKNPDHIEKTRHVGKSNGRWLGGKSFEPYAPEFNRSKKDEIKRLDGFVCGLCGKKNAQLQIHHIDYDKRHNTNENLVSLCGKCHASTLFNRSYWTKHLSEIVKNRL